MTRFNWIFFVFVFVSFTNCKGTKDKILFDKTTIWNHQQTDSLPLIPKDFLIKEKLSNGHCLVRGKSKKKVVALTFDDGPTDLSNKILDVLNTNNVKATFFGWVKILPIIEKLKKSKKIWTSNCQS